MAKVVLIPTKEYHNKKRISYASEPANFGVPWDKKHTTALKANLFLPPDGFDDPYLCKQPLSLRAPDDDNNNNNGGGERRSRWLRGVEEGKAEAEDGNNITVLGWNREEEAEADGFRPVLPIALLVKRGKCPFAQKAREAVALDRFFQQQRQRQRQQQQQQQQQQADSNEEEEEEEEVSKSSDPRIMYLIIYDHNHDGANGLFTMDGPKDELIDVALLFLTNHDGTAILRRIIDISAATKISPLLSLADYIVTTVPANAGGWYMPIELDGTSPFSSGSHHGSTSTKTNHPPTHNSRTATHPAARTFAFIRLVLVILLIITPCVRWGFLWCAAGGHIRFRRHPQTGRIIGLRIIRPTRPWLRPPWDLAANADASNDNDKTHKLTKDQVMALPQIYYSFTKDDHHAISTNTHAQPTPTTHDDDANDDDDDSSPVNASNNNNSTTTTTTDTKSATPIPEPTDSTTTNLTTSCTMCSICIDDFESGECIRILPRCNHAFHTDCILPWLTERRGSCPLCKLRVLHNDDDDDDDNDELLSDQNHDTTTNDQNQQQIDSPQETTSTQ